MSSFTEQFLCRAFLAVPVYFSCLSERCNAVLRWSSRNDFRTKKLQYAICTRVSRSWTVFSFLGALILRLTTSDCSSVMNTQTWFRPSHFAQRKKANRCRLLVFPSMSATYLLPFFPLFSPCPHLFIFLLSLPFPPLPYIVSCPLLIHLPATRPIRPTRPNLLRLVLFKVGLSVSVSVCWWQWWIRHAGSVVSDDHNSWLVHLRRGNYQDIMQYRFAPM